MGNWKTDRTAIFLCLVFLLFLVDLSYLLGIRDPSRFPHPFVIFRTLGDVEFLRGFPRMLRHTIFFTVSGGLIGVGVACLILRSVWLTQTALRALRLGLWLPTLILFVTPDVFALGIATAILCGCYYYLAATSFLFLPLSNISLIVLWLFSWVAVGWILPAPRFLDYWHKVIAVGCLTFFPFVQALWGLRDRPVPYRILLAIDNALPVAFVAMCYGEMYAATAGLGFMMVVASATSQFDKGLAGFLVTVALLVGLSSILRWTVRRLYFAEISA